MMKLFCRLAVVNHQGVAIENFSWASIEVRNMNNKSTPSEEEPFIIVRTSSNKTETRYNLIENIRGLFTQFLNKGRATVCLKEPSCSISIFSAEPNSLAAFITYVKKLLPADSPVHISMFALEPPTSQIYLACQEEYKLRMENIIETDTNLDQFTDLKIHGCTLELEGYQLPIADAIRKMKNLTTLRLDNIELRSSTFLEIESKELKQLHLYYCETPLPISSIFKNDLCYKDSLTELSLEGNGWSEIPNGIFQFPNLLMLLLWNKCPTKLPDKFTKLPKLQELSLSFNELTHLPPSICALQNLLELYLDFNELTELPDEFANLSKLQVLSLSSNQLRYMPPSIFQLQNLSGLSLSGNFITELPDKFTNLPKLKNLLLIQNQLTHLPPSICSLRLRKLIIDDNEFNFEIPPSFGSEVIVHSLKELSYRTILNHELKVKEGMLPEKFLKDLENHHQCVCGCKFVDEGQDVSFFCNLHDISRVITYERPGQLRFPIRGKMCNSLKSCLQDRFIKCQ